MPRLAAGKAVSRRTASGKRHDLLVAGIFAERPARNCRRRGDGCEDFRNTPSGACADGVGAEAHPGQARPRGGHCPRSSRNRRPGSRLLSSTIRSAAVSSGDLAALPRDLGEGLAGQRLQRSVLEGEQEHLVGLAGRPARIFSEPRPARISASTRARVAGILQPLDPGLDPAFLDPERHRGVEAGRAGRIGVHVGGDPQAPRARRLDPRRWPRRSCPNSSRPDCLKW